MMTHRVASTPLFYSPGLWAWFEVAKKTTTRAWQREFLTGFTAGRLTEKEMQQIAEGKYRTFTDGKTLILTIDGDGV